MVARCGRGSTNKYDTGGDVTSRLISLCLDAIDPVRQARFWAEALRWNLDDETPGELGLVPTDGTGFGILFEPVQDRKTGQNRVHLDLTTTSIDDQNDTVERLLVLGARHIDIGQGPDETHVVLADPEGNEFCVIEPTNNFLATCPRLGAVNCDGTQAAVTSGARRWVGHWCGIRTRRPPFVTPTSPGR